MSRAEEVLEQLIAEMGADEKSKLLLDLVDRLLGDLPRESKEKLVEKMLDDVDVAEIVPEVLIRKMAGWTGPHVKRMWRRVWGFAEDIPFRPWEIYEKMEETLREVVRTNREILEELRKQ